MTKKTTNNNQKEAKAAYIDAKITSMGFIVPVLKCPDCKTRLHFEDDSDICYCSKCGCKVKIESEDNNGSNSLKDVEGFDYVGIGVIRLDAGEGEYILCRDLKGYDLTNVPIYRYNNFLRTMDKVDVLKEDTDNYAYCVRRDDLINESEDNE